MTLTEKYNKLGNAICPICKTAICLKNSCTSEYHKTYTDLQIKLNLETMATKSKKWLLNGNDFIKGLILAIITALATGCYSAIKTGGITTVNLELIATTAILAGLSYLTKNLTENHEGKILKK